MISSGGTGVQWDPGVNGNERPTGHAGLAEDMAELSYRGHGQAVCRLQGALATVSREVQGGSPAKAARC